LTTLQPSTLLNGERRARRAFHLLNRPYVLISPLSLLKHVTARSMALHECEAVKERSAIEPLETKFQISPWSWSWSWSFGVGFVVFFLPIFFT